MVDEFVTIDEKKTVSLSQIGEISINTATINFSFYLCISIEKIRL
jgi:hypothetical protein